MITLKSIAIEGYKSIAKAEIELRDLNVIVGANGSGKSNFLDVIQLIVKSLTAQTDFKFTPADRFLHHGVKYTNQISLIVKTKDFQYLLVLKENLDDLNPEYEEVLDFSEGRPPIIQGSTESGKAHLKYSKSLIQNNINSFGHYHFEDTSDTAACKRTQDLHDNRFFRPDAGNLAAYLYRLKVNHPYEFSRIQDCIRLVAPYFEHFILEPQEIKGGFIKLEWKQKNSEAYFDAYSFSDGTLRFICLATLLMQPEPPALILLDEPELGLHPFAITLLAEMLADASVKSQIIVATQSVTLLNWMRPENIIVAEHDGSATTFNRPDMDKLLPWLDEFCIGELWEKNVIGGRP